MAKKSPVALVFTCPHFPQQNPLAIEVFCKVAEKTQPDLIISLGDVLDCGQFSSWPPIYGAITSRYEDDLIQANCFLDRLWNNCGRLVLVEGNHENRIDRWAAKADAVGRGTYSMLAPRRQLLKNYGGVRYIRYGSLNEKYPHFKMNPRIVCVHGWSYAKHATKKHLEMSQGKSIIHGHTHRVDQAMSQKIWYQGHVVQGCSAGCLCKLIPLYGTGNPVEWVNAFVICYMGKRSDTMYPVPIIGNRCILPSGAEVSV